jgi:hypothetical protein
VLIVGAYATIGLSLSEVNPEGIHLPLSIVWAISIALSLLSQFLFDNPNHSISILRSLRILSAVTLIMVLGINTWYVSLDGATTYLTWITLALEIVIGCGTFIISTCLIRKSMVAMRIDAP